MKEGSYKDAGEGAESILYKNMEKIIQDGYSKICELDKSADYKENFVQKTDEL